MTELMECPVCLERFDDPQQITACGHTFCRRCLERLAQRRCPTCRAAIPARNGFQPNFAFRQLLEDMEGRPIAESASAMAASTTSTESSTGQPSILRKRTRDLSNESEEDTARSKLQKLTAAGLPWGLARLMQEEDKHIALRIFLLDNSGSTASWDGKRLENNRMVSCTRWEETKALAMAQAKFNADVETPCEFMLLNPPTPLARGRPLRYGVDYLRVCPGVSESLDTQIKTLQQMLDRTHPNGGTPLSARIDDIYRKVSEEKEALAQAGQRIFLVIATDGVPSESKHVLVQTLRKISRDLPVNIVIRLTTNDDSVTEFYNKIDEELEFPLEVLDDVEGEAQEVRAKGNGWLTYSPLIHMLREQGTFMKLFDLLDERHLKPAESMVLARLMLQDDSAGLLAQDPLDFLQTAAERLRKAPLVYDPLRRRMEKPVNISALHASLIPLGQRLCPWCCHRRNSGDRRRSETWLQRLSNMLTSVSTPRYRMD